MFERFTDRARRVVVFAQEAAKELKQDYIGTEHILLGVLRENEDIAARVLVSMGVTYERAREYAIELVAPVVREEPPRTMPFTPRAKKVLELGSQNSIDQGHDYIGPEHILQGIIREDNYSDGIRENINRSTAVQILLKFGVTSPQLKHAMRLGLSGLALPVKNTLTLVAPRLPWNPRNSFSLEGDVVMQSDGRLASLTITADPPKQIVKSPDIESVGGVQRIGCHQTIQTVLLVIEQPDGTTQEIAIRFGSLES